MRRACLAGVAPAVVAAVAALALACTEVSTSPTTPVALEFDSLPFPAVVTGDTLRDSLGRAAPLRALAFNASGEVIAEAPIRYIALDTGVTIAASGILTAQARSGAVRIVAGVGIVQSQPRQLRIARRPDSVAVTGKRVDTLRYTIPDTATRNVSPALGIRIVTRDTAGGVTGTQEWLVSFQAFFRGQALAPSDTSIFSLWDEGGRISAVDTSAADGAASRSLRVRSTLLPAGPDSAIVVATVRYRGAQVAGSPVRFVIHLRPPQ